MAIVNWEGLDDVVVLRVAAGVTSVAWRVGGVTVDRMAPRDGWAVLVGPKLPQSTGFLTATEGVIAASAHGRALRPVVVDDTDVHPPAVPDAAGQGPSSCP